MRAIRSSKHDVVWLVFLAWPASATMLLAEPAARPVKRARPPKWTQEVLDVFFDDARAQLVGQRPDYASTIRGNESGPRAPGNDLSVKGIEWSEFIDAETIEGEVKRLTREVAADVATPGKFKSGAYNNCRRNFSVLAVLFGVAAEYDGPVRWSDAGSGLRDLFSQAGRNCRAGTDHAYREASQRSQDLSDLVRGNRPQNLSVDQVASWGQVADLAPLMQRLEIAHDGRLRKWLTDGRQFSERRADVRHEAQLVAVVAEVIGREGFEYWDDEQYAQYVRDLGQAARDIAAASESGDYDAAKAAVGRATRACNRCHEGYRG